MALTTIEYIYSGQATFPVNFALGNLSREYVTVRVNFAVDGAGDPLYYSDYSWISDSEILINGLVIGDTVSITRTIPKDNLVSTFSEGADVTRKNLDAQSKQAIMGLQEILDGRFDSGEIGLLKNAVSLMIADQTVDANEVLRALGRDWYHPAGATAPDPLAEEALLNAGFHPISNVDAIYLDWYRPLRDGSDETSILEQARDAAIATGLPVMIGEGTIVAENITHTQPVRYIGNGPSRSTIKLKDNASNSLIKTSGSASGWLFKDLTLDGNHTNQVSNSPSIVSSIEHRAVGVDFGEPSVLTCQNVVFKDAHWSGVAAWGDLDNETPTRIILEDCVFTGGADSVENAAPTNDWITSDIRLVDGADLIWRNCNLYSPVGELANGRSAVLSQTTSIVTSTYSSIDMRGGTITRRGINVSELQGAIDGYVWARDTTIDGVVFDDPITVPVRAKANLMNFKARYTVRNSRDFNCLAITTASIGEVDGNLDVFVTVEGAGPATASVIVLHGQSTSTTEDYLRNVTVGCHVEQMGASSTGIDLFYCVDPKIDKATIVGGLFGIEARACKGTIDYGQVTLRGQSNFAIYSYQHTEYTIDNVSAGVGIFNNTNTTYNAFFDGDEVRYSAHQNGGLLGPRFEGCQTLVITGAVITGLTGTAGFGVGLSTAVENLIFNGNTVLNASGAIPLTPLNAINVTNPVAQSGNNFQYASASPTIRTLPGTQVSNTAVAAGGKIGWVNTGTLTSVVYTPFGVVDA